MEPKHQIKSFLILSLLIFNLPAAGGLFTAQATVRFVSTTGSSTPPYTTWETAADSIQECINFSFDGDTIIVANGIYYESLIVDKYLWLIGSSMDSTVIDGTGLNNKTVDFQSDGQIRFFNIVGKGKGIANTRCVRANLCNVVIDYCRIMNAFTGIGLVWSSSIVNHCIITNVNTGFLTVCAIDTCNPMIINSVLNIELSSDNAIELGDLGNCTAYNNIVIGNQNSSGGIGVVFGITNSTIENNIVTGFYWNIDGTTINTGIIHNNISTHALLWGYKINSNTDMRNNVVANSEVGAIGSTDTNSDYNLYWRNNQNTGVEGLAENDIVSDPMFVNDTIPVYGGGYDYHLQAYSPAIDAGDPNILDVDGSRSDIGAYGGPGGEQYTYLDFAPRSPVNLSAEVDSLEIKLSWNKNTEADFSYYRIYRDTISGFVIDSTKLISSQPDTFYIQIIPDGITRLVYKLTAVDNQGNVSGPSEELIVNITTTEEYPITISDYKLYQNYPNPFNPSTKIGYRLKERGYVKLMVYDINGELIDVLVNEVKEAGYYEAEFNSETRNGRRETELASGIYLYRIEIIGDGNIPVFSEMKKMILVK